MGAVFKRKRRDKHGNIKESKNYWIKFYRHGKAISENSGTDKWADAKAFLKMREGDAAKGKPVAIRYDKVTFAELYDALEANYEFKGQSTTKIKGYRKNYLEPFRHVNAEPHSSADGWTTSPE